jgi:hypothetical protein
LDILEVEFTSFSKRFRYILWAKCILYKKIRRLENYTWNTVPCRSPSYSKIHSTQWDWSLLPTKNIQHNGTKAYYLQKHSTQWDWSLLPKNIQHNGTEAYYLQKNGLYIIFILLINSFSEQCICFRESNNWSMVGLHKFYLKKWKARSFLLTRMIKRGFLKTSGLPEHAVFINFKNHNMWIDCDVFVKISDQFKVWKQDKESKLLRKDIILASENPEHKDISNSKFSRHHVTVRWCLHWKRNKNSVYVASCLLTLAKTTKKLADSMWRVSYANGKDWQPKSDLLCRFGISTRSIPSHQTLKLALQQ